MTMNIIAIVRNYILRILSTALKVELLSTWSSLPVVVCVVIGVNSVLL